MPLQNNDILLVNRNGASHRYSFENLKRDVLSDIELQLTGLEWVARNPTGATEISALANTASTPRDWDTVDILLFGPGNDLSEVTVGSELILTNVTAGHSGTYTVASVNSVTRQIDVTYISDTGGDIAAGNTFQVAVFEPAVQYWTRDEATDTLSPVNEDDNVLVNGDLTVGSLNGGPLAGMRNRLINGNFIINQRSQAPGDVANLTFILDRWQVRRFGAGTVNFSQAFANDLGCYTCQLAVSGMTGSPGIMQIIEAENIRTLKDKQVTVSILATQAPTVFIGVFSNTGSETTLVNGVAMTDEGVVAGSFRRYSHTFTLTTATDFIGQSQTSAGVRVRFGLGTDASPPANQTVQFAQAMFEPGPVATPFEHLPIGTELALCQRYCQVIRNVRYSFFSEVQQDHYYQLAFNTAMRTNPSVATATAPTVTPGGTAGVNASSTYGITVQVATPTAGPNLYEVRGWDLIADAEL